MRFLGGPNKPKICVRGTKFNFKDWGAILPLRIKASAPQTARLVGHMAGQWHPLPATVQWRAAVPLHSARTTLLCNDGRLPGRGSRRDLRRAGAGIAAAHFAFGPSSQL